MQWRHTTQTSHRLQPGMVLRKIGWTASFGLGSNHSGWHQNVFRIFPVIIGVSALATTLLLGSFLWGIVSRKNKRRSATLAPFSDLYPSVNYKPNTVVTLREFVKPIPSASPKVSDYDNFAYFDTLVFDAEQGYAQVLAEARTHASTQKKPPQATSPVKLSAVLNDAQHHWLPRSSSARRHNFFDDLESVIAQNQDGGSQKRIKSSKSWKKLLFWKRSKKTDQFEFSVKGTVHSSCTTPLHYLFKSSKTRATVAPSTPPNTLKNPPIAKRSMSGPLYTDGSPLTPSRIGRSFSGPLSASSTPSRDGLYESPYMPLKRPGNTPKASSGPLYTT